MGREVMNITFLVGNGFDLNLGLKTSYLSFYDYFEKEASEENVLRGWIDRNDKLWSDLEKGLGVSTDKINPEETEEFYKHKLELLELLADYLQLEQNRVIIGGKESEIEAELVESLIGISNKLPNAQRIKYEQILNKYRGENRIFQFISFNYTSVLDQFVQLAKAKHASLGNHVSASGYKMDTKIGTVTHIHGTIDEEMILGVNDLSQINNIVLREDIFFCSVFVKGNMNKENDLMNEEEAIKKINESRIICIYGMSMGETDKQWWEKIIEWLRGSPDNLLIIHCYKEDMIEKRGHRISSRQLRREVINGLFEKGGVGEEDSLEKPIAQQIVVIPNLDIFNFKDILFDESYESINGE
jgi:hypothetical protein